MRFQEEIMGNEGKTKTWTTTKIDDEFRTTKFRLFMFVFKIN